MKKENLSIQILVLFLSLSFITSCTSQEASLTIGDKNLTENSENDSSIELERVSNQIGDHILTIFEDSRGNMWFGLAEKGLALYDGKSLRFYNTKNGLCGNTVANIVEDKNGELWFGTYSDMCRLHVDHVDPKNAGQFITFTKDKNDVPILGYGWKRVQTDSQRRNMG